MIPCIRVYRFHAGRRYSACPLSVFCGLRFIRQYPVGEQPGIIPEYLLEHHPDDDGKAGQGRKVKHGNSRPRAYIANAAAEHERHNVAFFSEEEFSGKKGHCIP